MSSVCYFLKRRVGLFCVGMFLFFLVVAYFMVSHGHFFYDQKNGFDHGIAQETFKVIEQRKGVDDRDLIVFENQSLRCLSFEPMPPSIVQSCMHLQQPWTLIHAYTQSMVFDSLPYFQQNPKHILLFGLGAGDIPRYLAKRLPESQLDVVEIDSDVIDLASEYFNLVPSSNHMRLFHLDAQAYFSQDHVLNHSQHLPKYDWIMIDIFEKDDMPGFISHVGFIKQIKDHLSPHGLLTINTFQNSIKHKYLLYTLTEASFSVNIKNIGGNAVILAQPLLN